LENTEKPKSRWEDEKRIAFVVSPEEYRAAKIKAAEYGITISDLGRVALADENLWQRAAESVRLEKIRKVQEGAE